jgi:hypothetical protein
MKGSNIKIFQKLEQVFAELRHHRQPKNTMTSCMQAFLRMVHAEYSYCRKET